MTDDRELLELAARAAGYSVRAVSGYEQGGTVSFYMEPSQLYWNPLTDDGDALRLAVCLRLKIELKTNHLYVIDDESGLVIAQAYIDDPYAATRRAIVRAAAALGKGMK
jgi:hypothetical protein